jgi:hypothetical protein
MSFKNQGASEKLETLSRSLRRPRYVNFCQQFEIYSRETVPLKHHFAQHIELGSLSLSLAYRDTLSTALGMKRIVQMD